MEQFLQSELEVNIRPIPIDEDVSYPELIKVDRNGDGFVNQMDDGRKVNFDNWKGILDAYLVYLDRYQPYDACYQGYREMDLNLNHQIERFEENFFKKKKEGEKEACVMILRKSVDERNLTEYQIDRATYALMNYFGHNQRRLQKRRNIAEKHPHSPFHKIATADFHRLDKPWFDYRFDKHEPRWLFSEYLTVSIPPRMHLYPDYMELIFYEAHKIFPYTFSDDVFMQKFVSALLWHLEVSIGKKSGRLRETKKEKKLENLRREIKRMKYKFDQLDLIYSYLSKNYRTPSYISDQVSTHQKRLRRFEGAKKTGQLADFHQALKVVQDYIEDSPDIQKNDYHLVVSALLKNHIENKKSFDDGNVLFSPDMLFAKGNGVCGDQSPALSLMLKELAGEELDARLYFWKRKYYYAHMSMIYRNLDGFYYIMDNQGIRSFRYASRDEAIRSNAPYAHEYRESISMDHFPGENKGWTNVLYGNKDTITSPDDKLTIKFSKYRKMNEYLRQE